MSDAYRQVVGKGSDDLPVTLHRRVRRDPKKEETT